METNEILQSPDFLEIVDRELDKKIVGEHEARKTIFLVAMMKNVANLNKATDNLLVNASSGTGKDHISEAVFELFKFDKKEELQKATPKVLSYTRNRAIKGQEIDTWQGVSLRLEDVENALLNDSSFKVFLSANPNKINYGKSVQHGKVVNIAIYGKPSIILTIANPNQNEETLRRLPICFLDEGIDQNKEIMKRAAVYAKTGRSLDYDEHVVEAIDSLERKKVKIPFAGDVPKIFDPRNVIVRTVINRFYDYIKTSCSLHQYQREMDGEGYLLATPQDYEIAAMMMRKTTSNILMIPLSKTRERIYELFKEQDLQEKSLGDLWEMDKVQQLGISESWLRKNCDWLVSKELLCRHSARKEGIDKPIHIYSYVKIDRFNIPCWEDLTKDCPDSESSKDSQVSPDSPNSIVNGQIGQNALKTQNTEKTDPVCAICGGNPANFHNGREWLCRSCAMESQK